jgi:putative transposase
MHDNYRVDAQRGVIRLRYYNIEIRFQGELRWCRQRLQQGRLTIAYDEVKKVWRAHIASEVKLKRDIRAPFKCGIDLGQEQLVAAVAEDGVGLLYRGSVLKSEYYYLKVQASKLDSVARFADFDRCCGWRRGGGSTAGSG